MSEICRCCNNDRPFFQNNSCGTSLVGPLITIVGIACIATFALLIAFQAKGHLPGANIFHFSAGTYNALRIVVFSLCLVASVPIVIGGICISAKATR